MSRRVILSADTGATFQAAGDHLTGVSTAMLQEMHRYKWESRYGEVFQEPVEIELPCVVRFQSQELVYERKPGLPVALSFDLGADAARGVA